LLDSKNIARIPFPMPRFPSFGFWYKDPGMDFEYCTRHFDNINIKKKVYENKILNRRY